MLGEVITPNEARAELPVSMSTAYQRMKKIKTFYFICTGIGVLGFALVAVPVQLGLLLDNQLRLRRVHARLDAVADVDRVAGRDPPRPASLYDRLFRKNPEGVVRLAGGFVVGYGVLLLRRDAVPAHRPACSCSSRSRVLARRLPS